MKFCFSEGLATPVGSIVTGAEPFIREARRDREAAGGGMPQAGVLAVAGLHALDHLLDRLADDHRQAQSSAAGRRSRGWRVDRETVETSILFVAPPGELAVREVVAGPARWGCWPPGPPPAGRRGWSPPMGIEATDIDRALAAFTAVSGGMAAGARAEGTSLGPTIPLRRVRAATGMSCDGNCTPRAGERWRRAQAATLGVRSVCRRQEVDGCQMSPYPAWCRIPPGMVATRC